jgi:V/A-type H+/Na+-transporting ATPase subunit A
VIRAAHEAMGALIGRDVPVDSLAEAASLLEVARMRSWPDAEAAERAEGLIERIRRELGAL